MFTALLTMPQAFSSPRRTASAVTWPGRRWSAAGSVDGPRPVHRLIMQLSEQ